MLLDHPDALLQGFEQGFRQAVDHSVRRQLFLVQGIPLTVEAVQGVAQPRGFQFAQGQQLALVEAGAVHLSGPLDQVVRLVHQQRQAPLVDLRQAEQQGALVEVVVVVGHQHVDPTSHLLAQVIRADLMGQGHLAQGRFVQHRHGVRRLARRWQAVVKALGQRTGIAMTGGTGVFTGFVARHQFQAAQRGLGAAGHHLLQRLKSQGAAGGLGGEEENLVQLLRDHGLEQREQGAEGLADAGGGLGHQAAAGADRLVHGFGQFALSVAKLPVGECQGLQALIAQGLALQLLLGPVQEDRALGIEKLLELLGAALLLDQGLFIAVDIQVDQRQAQRRQLALLAQQPAVNPGLGPVQLAVVVGLARQVATVGLDFFETVEPRVVTVGAAAHLQCRILAFETDFGLIALAAPGHHPTVPADALLGRGRRGETQVEIADLGAEFAQRPHRHTVAHGAHCTWQTSTGRPCPAQNSIQRSWLSCRRSPGPLTSIMR
ncbi:hypothetical protein D3C79_611450 [compost metagenome]